MFVKSAVCVGVLLLAGIAFAAGAGRSRVEPAPGVAAMLEDLPAAAAELPPQSPLREAVEKGELDRAREMLAFRPLAEAPLPEGFPAYTPVGVIEVKEYPVYRRAVGPSFWPLFQHIQRESIPMTAPVEMTPGKPTDGRMAFLYQNTAVGSLGPAEGVAVEDSVAGLAVSLGLRGGRTNERVADARGRLQSWVDDQPEYEAVGGAEAFRLLGYNSPMAPPADRYWEAQMLIRRVGGGGE